MPNVSINSEAFRSWLRLKFGTVGEYAWLRLSQQTRWKLEDEYVDEIHERLEETYKQII